MRILTEAPENLSHRRGKMVSSFLQIFLFIKTALIRYSMEEHYALTKDGYILTLHRIPRGREKQDDLEPTSNGHDDG